MIKEKEVEKKTFCCETEVLGCFVGGFEVAIEHGIWKCCRERKK